MNSNSLIPLTTESRQRLVTAMVTFTRDTALAASGQELKLLDQFVRGELTIDEVLARLESYALPPE